MKTFALSLAIIALSSCGTGGGADTNTHEYEMPPLEILEENFAQALYVLEIDVTDVRRVAEFRSDSGTVGYVQYSVTGTVLDVLKTSERHQPFSNGVTYRFTQESDETTIPAVVQGERYLVFLKEADEFPHLWLIGNGAQFELSPQLSETIGKIADH